MFRIKIVEFYEYIRLEVMLFKSTVVGIKYSLYINLKKKLKFHS